MEHHNPSNGHGGHDHPTPEATGRTADERARQWTFRAISPGDSHVKGEQSLCVGEAA